MCKVASCKDAVNRAAWFSSEGILSMWLRRANRGGGIIRAQDYDLSSVFRCLARIRG